MHIVIVANAPDFDAAPFAALLQRADLVIAADGGANALAALPFTPHVVIGDLDSLADATLQQLEAQQIEILRHPAEKDETDMELALLLAVQRGAHQISVLGAFGGRWDQTLANVSLLAMPELADCDVRLLDTTQQAFLVRDAADLPGKRGDIVSLLPLAGPAQGVTTRGLYYPLHNSTLEYEHARGVSNVLIEPPGQVSLDAGMLLIIQSTI